MKSLSLLYFWCKQDMVGEGLISAAEEVFLACEHRMCLGASTHSVKLVKEMEGSCELSMLGKNIMEDLLTYDIERWCTVYFKQFSKCDSIDNNMAESLNAWILAARHKTIVSMLEEIRIKVMNRIMKAFAVTWVDGISPMALKVFNANVERSMNCRLQWNVDFRFEVKEGQIDHIVHLGRAYCSCRTWQLKGIPCAHAMASMHYRRIDPVESIVDWYKIETYLQAYSHFIQPVPSMKI
ncbi:hypothetical protein H5410_054583 [Solanum commersonii]|uniref:SWIM-type domain-containing protein n=1 Tax=Solanum commersonii TaxID=4109 RepID=A0A9J5WFC9_SOLCO|nr:hypothetical protein H5410_054583 [Solanum commersonii]